MVSNALPGSRELLAFFEHPVFIASLTSWFLAQLIKSVIVLIRAPRRSAKEVTFTLMWRTGGMPSSHSSLVCALATSVGFHAGFSSTIFIVTLSLALIVMRDAVGVRRSSGIQARILNQLGKDYASRFGTTFSPVKEVQGHAPIEVLVGALLGFFIALALAVL